MTGDDGDGRGASDADGGGTDQAVVQRIVAKLRADPPDDRADVQRLKVEACREAGGPDRIPSNAEVLAALPDEDRDRFLPVLRTKPVRTASGVAVLAVMTDPSGCPHGTCTFCPGGVRWEGPDGVTDTPQSYTGHEPAARRGGRHGYDAKAQTTARLQALETNGHTTDKVDVIVMGGTFPARSRAYQDAFVKGVFDGLNHEESPGLAAAQEANEHAARRCVGLTVETKPDWCRADHVDRMLSWGTTRVEIGVQTLDDDVLEATRRGHTVADSVEATRTAKDAGLKVCHHVMPGLPGTTRARDLATFERLFDDPAFRPDMLKVYPTLVVPGTELFADWQAGRFEPLSTEEAADRVARMMAKLPPWCRIQRVDRDIPTHQIAAGVQKTNLRQLARARMDELGLGPCRCIRCREIGLQAVKGELDPGDVEGLRLTETRYEASGGTEVFLAFEGEMEEDVEDAVDGGGAAPLAGYLRLRFPGDDPPPHRPELVDPPAALVREVRVVGRAVALGEDPADSDGVGDGRGAGRGDGGAPRNAKQQHRGLGRRLMARAEALAADAGYGRVAVTSAVGTRAYYRKLGYRRDGAYMVLDGGG